MTSGYDIANEHYEDIAKGHVDFMGACGALDIPESVDPRPWYHIENQYSLSSCVGNGETGPLEVAYRNATGKIAQFSRMDAYLAAQRYSDIVQPGYHYLGHDGGALIAGARRAAMDRGCCLESTFPYPSQYSTHTPSGADAEAAQFKIQSSSVIKDYDGAKQYIGAGLGGILVGAPWPFTIGPNNTVSSFRNYGREGHAWCIIGYLKDLLIAANSWGGNFADKGFFYFTASGFNQFVGTRGVTAIGLSDLSVPRGRKVDWSRDSMFS